MPAAGAVPRDCGLCPRLVAYRQENKRQNPDWFNAPVPGFGGLNARLLIVGLAPGVTGANRTGRPFTGDFAGDLLYQTLSEFGFSAGVYDRRPDDGLRLRDCRISNAVKCVPPQNKPTGLEIRTCRDFFRAELQAMTGLQAVLALGRIAHDTVIDTLALKRKDYPFAHGRCHLLPDGRRFWDSYHCSRYNTNTGRLTEEMFAAVFRDIRTFIRDPNAPAVD